MKYVLLNRSIIFEHFLPKFELVTPDRSFEIFIGRIFCNYRKGRQKKRLAYRGFFDLSNSVKSKTSETPTNCY